MTSPSDSNSSTPTPGAQRREPNRLRDNALLDAASVFDLPREESRTLKDIVANLQRVPEPLVHETMPDPFVLRLTAQSPGGARTAGLWMVA
ncbi:MAG TPA: hypothetical protein VEY88_19880, partial [Archangium sp.]|nr:hypothetical protein [Archangium sp.]